jgi:hypothetical protein
MFPTSYFPLRCFPRRYFERPAQLPPPAAGPAILRIMVNARHNRFPRLPR